MTPTTMKPITMAVKHWHECYQTRPFKGAMTLSTIAIRLTALSIMTSTTMTLNSDNRYTRQGLPRVPWRLALWRSMTLEKNDNYHNDAHRDDTKHQIYKARPSKGATTLSTIATRLMALSRMTVTILTLIVMTLKRSLRQDFSRVPITLSTITTSLVTLSIIGVYHPLDGVTNLKYKLLCFLTPIKNFQRERH